MQMYFETNIPHEILKATLIGNGCAELRKTMGGEKGSQSGDHGYQGS